jgi:hypothetical protein
VWRQRVQQLILIFPEAVLILLKGLRVGLYGFVVLIKLGLIHQPRSHGLLGRRDAKVGKQLPHTHGQRLQLITLELERRGDDLTRRI